MSNLKYKSIIDDLAPAFWRKFFAGDAGAIREQIKVDPISAGNKYWHILYHSRSKRRGFSETKYCHKLRQIR